MSSIKFIDTHAHLDFENFRSDIDNVIEKSREVGVEKIIIPGVTLKDAPLIIDLIDKYENLFGAFGVHPSEAKSWNEESLELLKTYATHPKTVAIGEIGLDYYWDKSFIELQKEVFRSQLAIAHELNLPVIVHNREAHADTLDIMKEFPDVIGVMHCFSGSAEFAVECTKLGYFIALGGPVTFKNAKKPKEVAEKIQLDWLLTETDSPFLAPHPYRGKQNSPEFIQLIAEQIATIKNIPVEEVAVATYNNALKLFNL